MVRRGLRLTVRLAGWLLASLVVLAALVVWRLSSGPLPLDVLTPYLARALSVGNGEVVTTVEASELRISRTRGVALVALGVRAHDARGEVLFDLPEVEVGLSTAALLRHQVLAPERLRVRAPRVILVRRADGSVGLGGRTEAAEPGGGLLDLELLAGIVLAEPEPALPLSFVDLIQIEGASVTLRDEVSGTSIEAAGGALSVVREGGALAARARVEIDDRDGGPLGLHALARLDPVRGQIDAALDLDDLRPVDLGLIRDLLPPAHRAQLDALPLDGFELAADGRIRARTDLRGRLLSASLRLGSTGGQVTWPGQLERPLEVDALALTGAFDPGSGRFSVEQLKFAANGASIRATGSGRLTPAGPEIRAEVTVEDVAVDQLAALWPLEAADEARAWVTENITAGRAERGVVLVDLRPGDLDQRPLRRNAVRGSFSYDDLTIRYFKPLPAIEQVDGSATFDAQTMTFKARHGRLGELAAESALITVTGIGIKGRDTTQLNVESSITGPLQAALALIDLPPFGFASEFGIDPAAARGAARTRLTVGLPLHRDVDEDEVRIHANASLSGVAVDRLFGLADLAEGAFELEVDRATMTLRGRARYADAPLEVDWEEAFDHRDYDRRIEIRGTVDPAVLAALGVQELPVSFDGAARTRISAVDRPARLSVEADLDLTTARLAFAPLDWRKPLGEPADLRVSLHIEDAALRVERLQLESATLEASGSGVAGLRPFELRDAAIERFEQGEQRLSATVRVRPEDGLAISIDARRLDLRPFLGAEDGPAADRQIEPGPMKIEIRADEVVLADEGALAGLEGRLVRDREGWAEAELEGVLGNGRSVRLTLAPVDGRRRLVVTSDDAGELLQTFEPTRRIEGGALRLEADLEAQRPALRARGRLLIDDFTLRGAPTLARLLTVASFTGIGNLLQGEGIFVDRLALPFRLDDDRLILEQGRLSGSQLGLTVEGTIDLEAEELDLEGTVVPVYGLNRAIGAIPVIGDFLAGSEGVGAFAASYGMSGPFDDPEVSVNPLSALTPGFLRDLVTGIREGTLEPPDLPVDRN